MLLTLGHCVEKILSFPMSIKTTPSSEATGTLTPFDICTADNSANKDQHIIVGQFSLYVSVLVKGNMVLCLNLPSVVASEGAPRGNVDFRSILSNPNFMRMVSVILSV